MTLFSWLDILFAVWLVASAVNQFDWTFWSRVTAFDVFGLLPRWTFFAPQPGTDDIRLVYRDVFEGGSHSSWTELQTAPCRPALIRMVWNPEKLDSKAVFDLVQLLAQEVEGYQSFPKAMLVSLPYIQLLEPIMQALRADGAMARQFALVSTRGHAPPRDLTILMLSSPHGFGL